jgi:hypothetical protein
MVSCYNQFALLDKLRNYNNLMDLRLIPRTIGNSSVSSTSNGWRMEMGVGEQKSYRLAQLDDYVGLGRKNFPHTPPFTLRLRARVSAADIPGTWGFGLWNDPFGLSIGFGGRKKQLPALPQVAWFFYGSKPNSLALRDSPVPGMDRRVPADGFFAGTLHSRPLPSALFIPGIPALPLFTFQPFSRLVRKVASRFFIQQDGTSVDVDVTAWHEYLFRWEATECVFRVDGAEVLRSQVSPRPPLGLVLWIDNQFAAWTPEGRIGYGTLANEAAWVEVEGLRMG